MTPVIALRASRQAGGFSLIEVLVALGLLMGAILGLVQLFAYTARATAQGRRLTTGTVLAAQKLDQLRTLAWTYDGSGAPLSDVQSDTAATPEHPSGGTGLAASPSNALDVNTSGYCDFLDEHGRSLGGGTAAPAGTMFVRRWAIRPLTNDPADTVVIQVRLLSRDAATRRVPDPAGVVVTTVRTRLMW